MWLCCMLDCLCRSWDRWWKWRTQTQTRRGMENLGFGACIGYPRKWYGMSWINVLDLAQAQLAGHYSQRRRTNKHRSLKSRFDDGVCEHGGLLWIWSRLEGCRKLRICDGVLPQEIYERSNVWRNFSANDYFTRRIISRRLKAAITAPPSLSCSILCCCAASAS